MSELYSARKCWLIYIMPGGSGNNDIDIFGMQKNCIEKNCFGMGWGGESGKYSSEGEKKLRTLMRK